MATRPTHGLLDERYREKLAMLFILNICLQTGYQWILKDLKDTQNQQLILKQYHLKVKEILHQTKLRSLERNKTIEAEAERCLAEFERGNYTILVAGEASAAKSGLINLVLNERLLPSSILQDTMPICEISYGPEKEAVLHFLDKRKSRRILRGGSFEDQIKAYIQKSTEDEDWCEKIEIRLPNTLLEGGIVIVNIPEIGDSERVREILRNKLSLANAFIYVIDSRHEDRLRFLDEWMKLYDGKEESSITAESALFVCNKWDVDEGEADETERKEIDKNIILNLRKRIPQLDEECQLVRISMKTATDELMRSGKMNTELYALICGIRDLLPRYVKMRAAFLYFLISGQINWLKDMAKVEIQHTQSNGIECLRTRDELKEILQKLDQGFYIQEIEDAISHHEEDLCKKLTSYLRSDEVQREFCNWSEKDIPKIGKRHDAKRIKLQVGKCIDRRLDSLLETVEKREKHFAKARTDLENKRLVYFSDLQKGICDIDRVLDSEDQFTPIELRPGRICSPFYAKMKKVFVAAGILFMPAMIPVGLIAGALFAPVFGYRAVEKHLKEQQLRNNPCQALKELSSQSLESFIKEDLRDHVRRELFSEKTQIVQIKRCHAAIITKYHQLCENLDRKADNSRDRETLDEKAMVDLFWKLRNMTDKLLLDAIQNGVPVMYPSGQIDGKKLSCNEEELLGSGRSAKVYRGTLKGKCVAVKRLQEEHHPRNIAWFLEEAGMLKQVKHPHIVTFHGVSMNVQNGRLMSLDIVLELCATSLKDQIFNKKRNIPWMNEDAAVKILRCTLYILLGLEFLHGNGIVHRDIKLCNMLLTKDKVIKIADFGWAKSESLITGTQCGTPFHMAPEVREGKPYGSKVDMYSFGIMMWEMWYGKEIFSDLIKFDEEISPPTEVKDYLSKAPKGLGSFAPPADWTKLMKTCCNAEPDQRPTATECYKSVKEISRRYENAYTARLTGDPEWEIPRARLNVGEVLGSGAFGVVSKGWALDLPGKPGWTVVAVKSVKDYASQKEKSDLLSEMSLLKSLDPHPHVIRLYGCVTTEARPLVVVEYAQYGDLLGYLKNSPRVRGSYCRDPSVESRTSLSSKQLLRFAWQISDGMDYLSKKKIIHRDLAARNVLVGDQCVCKITDFGMSRDVWNKEIYVLSSQAARLPVKWTAPEALLENYAYTTQSDVWSFGVVMYEVFTLGEEPFPGVYNGDIPTLLREGYRMARPNFVSAELYSIMMDCWKTDPSERPKFDCLRSQIHSMIWNEEQEYVNLGELLKNLNALQTSFTGE